MEAFKFSSPMDMIKHIFTLHDGEVRHMGAAYWIPFPAPGENIMKVEFWPCQFCRKVGAVKT